MAEPVKAEERASLSSVLNYKPDEYISSSEIEWIKSVFGTPESINTLRKIFLPTVGDGGLPLENFGLDVYLQGFKWEQIPADEAKILAVARQDVIKFIMGGLVKLKVIAAEPKESPMEEALRRSQDSNQ